jgi:hypothetical protein
VRFLNAWRPSGTRLMPPVILRATGAPHGLANTTEWKDQLNGDLLESLRL